MHEAVGSPQSVRAEGGREKSCLLRKPIPIIPVHRQSLYRPWHQFLVAHYQSSEKGSRRSLCVIIIGKQPILKIFQNNVTKKLVLNSGCKRTVGEFKTLSILKCHNETKRSRWQKPWQDNQLYLNNDMSVRKREINAQCRSTYAMWTPTPILFTDLVNA